MNTADLAHDQRTEAWLSLALDTTRACAWEWHRRTDEMRWWADAQRLFGSERDCPATFEAFLERVHPADRELVGQTMSGTTSLALPCELEFRMVDAQHIQRWIWVKSSVRHDKGSETFGVFVDVTAQHNAERELRELSSRLLSAHEQERSRLSRELHDDVSQRLMLIAIEFDELRQHVSGDQPHARDKIVDLSAQLRDVTSTLHHLSHQLHPALIRQVGFEQALRSLCSDVGRMQQLVVHCRFANSGTAIDDDVALGLYRIAQEALRTAVKHSGAADALVSLAGSDDQIVLCIADNGVGFCPTTVAGTDSLGLISMRERARLMNGQLNVISKPGAGTRVEVLVPTLATKMDEP